MTVTDEEIKRIARVCHEANRVWCALNGDNKQPSWEDAENWQRQSSINSVKFILENKSASNSALHDEWFNKKIADGWVYGDIKDSVAKTHPCLIPYSDLPLWEQKKDGLFRGIVLSLT